MAAAAMIASCELLGLACEYYHNDVVAVTVIKGIALNRARALLLCGFVPAFTNLVLKRTCWVSQSSSSSCYPIKP
jgi:hypothetical protein